MRSLFGQTVVPLSVGLGSATRAIDVRLASPSSHEHGHDEHGHGHHDHEHGHGHHDHDLRDVSRKSLTISFVLITTYMVAEIVGGLLSGSLALLADAGHMATDAGAIAMALFAMWMANREASTERTYGYYRTEVLAAMLNALALWLIVGWIMYEAVERFGHHGGEIEGWSVLFVGLGGLIVNLITVWILHRSAEHSINAEGAFQHVLADLLGSVGVVVSAVLVITLGWTIADPILSVVIGLLIMLSSWRLVTRVFHVLLEGTPEHIDVYRLCSEIEDLEGVTIIHDVHVWTITSGSYAFTAHVLVDPAYDDIAGLRERVQRVVHHGFGIGHATFQLEKSTKGCVESHHVDHLVHRARPTGLSSSA